VLRRRVAVPEGAKHALHVLRLRILRRRCLHRLRPGEQLESHRRRERRPPGATSASFDKPVDFAQGHTSRQRRPASRRAQQARCRVCCARRRATGPPWGCPPCASSCVPGPQVDDPCRDVELPPSCLRLSQLPSLLQVCSSSHPESCM
jgi:hypothetical protein